MDECSSVAGAKHEKDYGVSREDDGFDPLLAGRHTDLTKDLGCCYGRW